MPLYGMHRGMCHTQIHCISFDRFVGFVTHIIKREILLKFVQAHHSYSFTVIHDEVCGHFPKWGKRVTSNRSFNLRGLRMEKWSAVQRRCN